jgi:hypothetical protein
MAKMFHFLTFLNIETLFPNNKLSTLPETKNRMGVTKKNFNCFGCRSERSGPHLFVFKKAVHF